MTTTPQDTCTYNFVASEGFPPHAPVICDVTLRDGEQTIDAAFNISEKVEVIHKLEAARLETVQVGFAASRADREAVSRAHCEGVSVPLELALMGLTDSWKEDVTRAIDAGVNSINVFVRSSAQLLESMGLSQGFLLQRIADIVELAKSAPGVVVAAGPSFATTTELSFLDRVYAAAESAGADQLVINDTLGVASPQAMAYLVNHLTASFSRPVRVHCHNDFGLATANALASWEAGATLVDVAVAGLGERAGNVPVEEFVMALTRLYDRAPSTDAGQLVPLARFMAKLLNTPIPPNKAVIGANGFAQMVEMHVKIAKDHPEQFEPYDPALVGAGREIRIGKGSGPIAVATKLGELGIDVPKGRVDELVREVNEFAIAHKRALADNDIRAMAKENR